MARKQNKYPERLARENENILNRKELSERMMDNYMGNYNPEDDPE